MAYSSLSSERNAKIGELYANLAEHFVILMDIMHCMREINENIAAIDLSQAEELWQDTHSLHALNVIRKATRDRGFVSHNLLPFKSH
jgi:hypothetical protein